MARSTRLFQRAGSPLIQGNSRLHRPLGPTVAAGIVVGTLAGPLYAWALRLWVGDSAGPAFSDVVSTWGPRSPGLLLGATAGALLGAAVGRAWGALRLWIPATGAAVVLALAAAWAYAALVL